MTTEEALIQAVLENWEERDVKLRLADHLRESGEESRADLLELLSKFEWVSLPDRDFPDRLRYYFQHESSACVAVIFPTEAPDRYLIFVEIRNNFYSGESSTPEEGIRMANRFFLGETAHFLGIGEAYAELLKYVDPL